VLHHRRSLALTLLLVAAAGSVLGSVEASGAGTVTLGSSSFAGTYGKGWGSARPAVIYNGGDPSGLVREIQWTSWSGGTAIGFGLGNIFRPRGGYYPPVLVELRAQALGHCGSHQAYTQLAIRTPPKPEAPLGSWHLWSEAKSLCHFGF
jgi:hypothetical protein